MTTAERRRKAKAMEKKGLSLRAMGRELGVHHETVNRDLHPLLCPSCGKPGIAPKSKLCRSCRREAQQKPVFERGEEIEKMWAQGMSLEAMAKKLRWTVSHLGMEIHRLREKGFDLPYRQNPTKPRFKKQVPK